MYPFTKPASFSTVQVQTACAKVSVLGSHHSAFLQRSSLGKQSSFVKVFLKCDVKKETTDEKSNNIAVWDAHLTLIGVSTSSILPSRMTIIGYHLGPLGTHKVKENSCGVLFLENPFFQGFPNGKIQSPKSVLYLPTGVSHESDYT